MKRGKTRSLGSKTQSIRRTALMIDNKDPSFDYSFRRRKDIDEGGGQDMYGYVPVQRSNNNDEVWHGPKGLQTQSKAKQIVYQDTILCKRPKEVSQYFQQQEDEKYNSQVRLVLSTSKRVQMGLRQIDPDATVEDGSNFNESGFSQKIGPTTGGLDG